MDVKLEAKPKANLEGKLEGIIRRKNGSNI
jgi:hypothetical protein